MGQFSIPSGATRKVRLRLSKQARTLLTRKRTLGATATLRATANATAKTTRQIVTVKDPRRR